MTRSCRGTPLFSVALRKESVDRNILSKSAMVTSLLVALRKESVDRNDAVCANNHKRRVALRKESVDRNSISLTFCSASLVALRKESVDRNLFGAGAAPAKHTSLSARRAWIEMQDQFLRFRPRDVALRKESVDRNGTLLGVVLIQQVSLSARRAWIEIWGGFSECIYANSRSPQGERG